MKKLLLRAPAKINLGLHVLKRREDRYHEIETVMQMVSLFDDLLVEEGPRGILVETDHRDLPAGRGNLIYRAADLLAEASRTAPAVRLRLVKRIPVSAGLGGGSSDAAAALIGLNRLWDLSYPRERLMELAGRIGMDVPFFLFSATALARGRGDLLEKLASPAPPLWLLLVHPGFGISTRTAYQGLKLGLTTENKHISIREFTIPALGRGGLENDLEKVAFEEYPVLREMKHSIEKLGALSVSMSGSGPTIFGVFPDREKALEARGALAKRKDLSVFMVHTLRSLPE